MNVWLGLLGILGIWLTAGVCLPLVGVFKDSTVEPEQLMVVRGVVTALLAACFAGFHLQVHLPSLLAALSFALACLGLFKGVVTWGASRTIVVITATPAVNLLLHPSRMTSNDPFVFLFILMGVCMATDPRGLNDRRGLWWSIFGTAMNGLFYEFSQWGKPTGYGSDAFGRPPPWLYWA